MLNAQPSITTRNVATAVTAAWQRTSNNPSTLEIPLGTVATLALHAQIDGRSERPACPLAQLDRADLLRALSETWARTWLDHPHLVQIASPLHRWLDDEVSDETVRAIRAVFDAAHHAGLPHLVDPRRGVPAVDALGFLVTELRPARARQHLGEFYTHPRSPS